MTASSSSPNLPLDALQNLIYWFDYTTKRKLKVWQFECWNPSTFCNGTRRGPIYGTRRGPIFSQMRPLKRKLYQYISIGVVCVVTEESSFSYKGNLKVLVTTKMKDLSNGAVCVIIGESSFYYKGNLKVWPLKWKIFLMVLFVLLL